MSNKASRISCLEMSLSKLLACSKEMDGPTLIISGSISSQESVQKWLMMQVSSVLPDVSAVLTSAGGCRSQEVKHCSSFVDAKCFLSPGFPKNCIFPNPKLEVGPEKLRTRSFTVRASGNSAGDLIPVAPLQLESPVGQLLTQILQTHPHLLLVTAEQQLENLQSQRDGQKETNAPSAQDLLLYNSVDAVVDICSPSLVLYASHLLKATISSVGKRENVSRLFCFNLFPMLMYCLHLNVLSVVCNAEVRPNLAEIIKES
ncbi:hypothetical protein DH2020_025302 [Rehmannia glutinosa]|uniref:Uncharacterized protein n=1 Tax=Rehmannia glutinosa TaxID=99300 RepID=A0ABR0W4C0_REHGL